MKDSFYLFLVCLFFVSCNKSIHFASDVKDPVHFVDYSLLYETPKFTPPDSAQPVSLNDPSIDFIQLVSADVTALRLPAGHLVDFTNKPEGEEKSFVRSDMSLSPFVDIGTATTVDIGTTSFSNDGNTENETIKWDLAEQERKELVVASLERQKPGYPVSPELDLRVKVKDSNEGFVPESGLTLGGHEDFIPLAAADINSLRLSVHRPLDIADKQEGVEDPFVRSGGISVSPSIDMTTVPVNEDEKTENGNVKLDLAKQERNGLVVASLERQQPGYPVSPELDLRVEVKDSNEDFIPESGLTLGGHEDFIPLAAADVNSLRLSVHRPLDIADKQEGAEDPFVRSGDISVSPSIDMEANSVRNENTEDEAIEWDLAEQERKELVVALTEGEQPHYPSSPLWVVEADGENAPEELFIPRLLDILFVMDTSESMHAHLVSFKEKFMGFLKYFFNFNWRLAITDADHGEHGFFLFNMSNLKGKAMRLERSGSVMDLHYLDRTVEHYNRVFLDSISRHRLHEYQKHGRDGLEDMGYCELPPYCQGGNEQPLKSLKSALVKNKDFFRKNADLVVVLVSNSKERSSDYVSGTQPEEVIEEFRVLYGEEKRFEVYGIIIPEDDKECLEQNNEGQFWSPEGAFSEKIARLSEMTGGETFSICSDNYEELARSIFHSFGTSEEE